MLSTKYEIPLFTRRAMFIINHIYQNSYIHDIFILHLHREYVCCSHVHPPHNRCSLFIHIYHEILSPVPHTKVHSVCKIHHKHWIKWNRYKRTITTKLTSLPSYSQAYWWRHCFMLTKSRYAGRFSRIPCSTNLKLTELWTHPPSHAVDSVALFWSLSLGAWNNTERNTKEWQKRGCCGRKRDTNPFVFGSWQVKRNVSER